MIDHKQPYFTMFDNRFPSFQGQGDIHPTPYDAPFVGASSYSHISTPWTDGLISPSGYEASLPSRPPGSSAGQGIGMSWNHLYHRFQQLEKENENNKKMLKVFGKRLNIIEQRLGIPAPPFEFN
ncbi:hypothetical protein [Scopulibacillus cellulosilyticus]|uniref:Uncharacterized protein n=1 Tax=Scopulibacillus cellulosilyticus TaxID=2665665 RepID=A0ABW2PY07_9BACL